MMKERPLLMRGPLVCATLEDRKWMTRRIVVPTQSTPRVAPLRMEPWMIDGVQETDDNGLPCWAGYHPDYPGEAKWFSCPHGGVGDRLWIRETWHPFGQGTSPNWISDRVLYRADNEGLQPFDGCASHPLPEPIKWSGKQTSGWKPSIFMPRWASRLAVEITAVRVERVQDISEEDAKAEGCVATEAGNGYPFAMSARMNFVDLWDDINARRGYGWANDPWVWAISYRRITP